MKGSEVSRGKRSLMCNALRNSRWGRTLQGVGLGCVELLANRIKLEISSLRSHSLGPEKREECRSKAYAGTRGMTLLFRRAAFKQS